MGAAPGRLTVTFAVVVPWFSRWMLSPTMPNVTLSNQLKYFTYAGKANWSAGVVGLVPEELVAVTSNVPAACTAGGTNIDGPSPLIPVAGTPRQFTTAPTSRCPL